MSSDVFHDDEEVIANAQGVLGGEGFQEFEKVTEKIAPDKTGYTFTLHCLHCHALNAITISWEEFIVVAERAVPLDPDTRQPWIFRGGKATPPIHCGACARQLVLWFTPDQCQRYVSVAVNQLHALTWQQVQQRAQQVQQQLRGYGR